MLIERIMEAVNLILKECSEFEVVELLNKSISLASQRGQIRENQYQQIAKEIRDHATYVIESSKVHRYTTDISKILNKSQYSAALPANVAGVLLNGFPDIQANGLPSTEVRFYLNLVNGLISDFTTFQIFTEKMSIHKIEISGDEIGIDILLPGKFLRNKAPNYVSYLSNFVNAIEYFVELSTGSSGSPNLTYTSSSDPITGLATTYGAIWGFLKLYKLALDVAEKQINFFRMVRELRVSTLSDSGALAERIAPIIEQIAPTIKEQVGKAVIEAVDSFETKLSQERKNEIKNGLRREMVPVVNAIANGARVGISPESIERLSQLPEMIHGLTHEAVTAQLEGLRALERKLESDLAALGEQPVGLLIQDTAPPDSE